MTALSWTHSKEGKGIKESSPTDRHQALWGERKSPADCKTTFLPFPQAPPTL